MPPLAFTLALAAAVLHAFWNILLARARDPESATAVALLAAVIVFAPVTALRFDAEWAVWPFIVVTSLLQLLYFALLATAYRKAELSFVYPVARGVAPASSSSSRSSRSAMARRLRRSPASSSSARGRSSCAACGRRGPARTRVRPRYRLRDRVLHAARQARDHAREPDHVPRVEHASGGTRLRRRRHRRQGPGAGSCRARCLGGHRRHRLLRGRTRSCSQRSASVGGIRRRGARDERRDGDGICRGRAARAREPVEARQAPSSSSVGSRCSPSADAL